MYKNFHEFIDKLEKEGELIRIKEFVDPFLEITEITDRISKSANGGKALLFENTGTKFPLITNAFGSDKRMALALGYSSLESLSTEISNFFEILTSPKKTLGEKFSTLGTLKKLAQISPKIVKKGQCQEIILKNPDINIFPILQCWPQDGGRFITLPIVHTKDPNSKIRNIGMYRMQIFDKDLTGMHWHKHKVGARHYKEYKELHKKIPIAVALGGDPVYTYCATAPLPDNIDEYLLAGFIRKKGVKLVKCITQEIEVPADAEIIIEGYVDPQEELIWEGPFGDHTGFYSLADYYPKFHITCITHRKDAIYPATIVGIPPQEDAYLAKATEKIFLPLLQKSIAPEILDMNLPESGVAHNFTIIKIKSQFEGHALRIMNSLWGNGQMSLNKCLFVTDDEKIDISNYKEFAQKSLANFNPTTDVVYSQGPIDVLDHASEKFTLGSKIGFSFSTQNVEKNKNNNLEEIKFEQIKELFPNITNINSLLKIKIPVIFIASVKNERIINLAEKIIEEINFSSYKIIIFLDQFIDLNNIYDVMWIIGNNIAPRRDTKIIDSNNFKNTILFVDATSKNKEIDSFERIWPEVIRMDAKTIEKVDKNWEKYNINEFIPSPSQKFIKL